MPAGCCFGKPALAEAASLMHSLDPIQPSEPYKSEGGFHSKSTLILSSGSSNIIHTQKNSILTVNKIAHSRAVYFLLTLKLRNI